LNDSNWLMPENPWSDDAGRLICFVYEFWCRERRPPNLLDIHQATGLAFRDVRRLYRELKSGFAVSAADESLQLGLLRAPPFSAVPTPVACYAGERFLSYLGCPAEATTVGRLPWLEQLELTIRTYCACCCQPIEYRVKGQNVLSPQSTLPLVAFLGSPFDWEDGVGPERVCDDIHFVLDADHAVRAEQLFLRRGVLASIEQISKVSNRLAEQRARDPNWGPVVTHGAQAVDFFDSVGVDVSLWRY
jgi:hypothetical protein